MNSYELCIHFLLTTGDKTTTEDEVASVDYNTTPPHSRTPSTSPRREKSPVSTPTRLPTPVRKPAHLEHVPLPQKLFEPKKAAKVCTYHEVT